MEERVQKIIAAAGIASRRAAEELILDGRVRVNGKVVAELGTKADPERDHIKVDGKLINPRQPKTYVMLNKPVGYVTTMSDPEGRPVVSSLLQGIRTRVYPVGRLDYNTEGLLLLTNDGDFAHLVTHPRHELPKTYLVKVKGVLEDRDVENLERGVFLKDGKTAPARVRKLRKEESNSWVEITIHEGRKRQVRRMIDHTGKSVIKLKRSRIGSLDLGDLALGTYRHLTAEEVNSLRETAQGGEKMMPTGTVSVPSGPGGARRQLTFIEGPKPKKRPPAGASSRRSAGERHPAKRTEGGKPFRQREPRERMWEGKAPRREQQGRRPESKRPWQGEKRFSKPAFGGGDRPSQGRTSRPGDRFKPRESAGRPFGGRTARPEQQGRRPEGKRPWQGEERFSKPAFGWDRPSQGRTSRPDERFKPHGSAGRPFGVGTSRTKHEVRGPEGGKGPWPTAKRPSWPGARDSRSRAGDRRPSETKTGWSRPGGSRDRKGRGPGRV